MRVLIDAHIARRTLTGLRIEIKHLETHLNLKLLSISGNFIPLFPGDETQHVLGSYGRRGA
jgi:hypothetical protein